MEWKVICMKRKNFCELERAAKYVVKIVTEGVGEPLFTAMVKDNKRNRQLENSEIEDRGIWAFGNLRDLKETLNWNLNGDEDKYMFLWDYHCKKFHVGTALVFD